MCPPPARYLLPVLLVAAALSGGEDPERVAIKAQLRAVYDDAQRTADLWTMLQAEAYGRTIDLPLRGVLGSSAVHGNPLLGFPQDIEAYWDHGDAIGVVSGARFYLVAGDGRPLATGTPLPIYPDRVDWSQDGKVLGLADRRGPAGAKQIHLLTIAVPSAAPVPLMHVIGPLASPDELYYGRVAVAADGSAMAAGLYYSAARLTHYRVVIARKGLPLIGLPGFRAVRAVGPNGSWLVCENPEGATVVATIEKRWPVAEPAIGPGLVAFMQSGRVTILDGAGASRELSLPIGLGAEARVTTVGRYLVVDSGQSGREAPTKDILGNVMPGGSLQAEIMAIYRWSDLATRPNPRPARLVEGRHNIHGGEAGGLLLTHGREINWLDLSGAEPVLRSIGLAREAPRQVRESRGRLRVLLPSGAWQVLDRQCREVWHGSGDRLEICDRDWGIIETGPEGTAAYQVVRFDLDPARRSAVKLLVPAARWEITNVDRHNRNLVASRYGAKWMLLDQATGVVRDEYVYPDPAGLRGEPSFADPWADYQLRPGRVFKVLSRLIDKTTGDTGPAADRLLPADAWPVGRGGLLVVGRDDEVFVPGPKTGDYLPLGWCPQVDHIGVLDNNQPVLIDGSDRVCARLEPDKNGPRLDVIVPRVDAKVRPMPELSWRITSSRDFSRGGRTLEWNTARLGFAPLRLRSPDANGTLLVVTGSLVLVLDSAAVQAVVKAP